MCKSRLCFTAGPGLNVFWADILKSFLVIPFLVFLTIPTIAQNSPDEYNQEAFETTLKMCAAPSDSDPQEIAWDFAQIGRIFGRGAWTGAHVLSPGAYKLNPQTTKFITSRGFEDGLDRCYGTDNLTKNAAKAGIVIMDWLGHGLVWYAGGEVLAQFAKVF